MTGTESSPASLFRLYVDCGRYAEAVNLLTEYIETLSAVVSCGSAFPAWQLDF